jgi:cardiolipin synthase (CMP-forming)
MSRRPVQAFISWTRDRMFHTGISAETVRLPVSRVFTVANCLTFARLLAIVPLSYFVVVAHNYGAAFLLLAAMSVADAFDGYIARRYDQVSRLGKTLDPWADRLTIIAVVFVILLAGLLPRWLTILILARDFVLLASVCFFYVIDYPVPFSRIKIGKVGKLGTAALLVGLPFTLLGHTGLPLHVLINLGSVMLILVGVALYYFTLGQYIKADIKRHRTAKSAARPSAVAVVEGE